MSTLAPGKALETSSVVTPKEGSRLTFSANNPLNLTTPSSTAQVTPTTDSTSHVLTYVFVPIGSIILVLLIAGLIVFLIRKSRLDKLRHHLMPLYNFDPAEEGEDWESELLEDGMDHRMSSAHMKMRVER